MAPLLKMTFVRVRLVSSLPPRRLFSSSAKLLQATVSDDVVVEEKDPRLSEERPADECDLLIVGGGPSGLAAAIKFKQLCAEAGKDYRVCLVEKGGEVGKGTPSFEWLEFALGDRSFRCYFFSFLFLVKGAHILSGAVVEPRAINELFPNWKELGVSWIFASFVFLRFVSFV